MRDTLYEFIKNHAFADNLPLGNLNNFNRIVKELDDRGIVISYDTLELIYACTVYIKNFLLYIDLLYLDEDFENDYYPLSERSYLDLFKAYSAFYKEDIIDKYDPYLINTIKSLEEIDFDDYQKAHEQLAIIYKYYWLNRYNIKPEKLSEVVKVIVESREEIFLLNGMWPLRNDTFNRENLNMFLDNLFNSSRRL